MRFNLVLPFLTLDFVLGRPRPPAAAPAEVSAHDEEDPWAPRIAVAVAGLGAPFAIEQVLAAIGEPVNAANRRRARRVLATLGYQSRLRTVAGASPVRCWVAASGGPSPSGWSRAGDPARA